MLVILTIETAVTSTQWTMAKDTAKYPTVLSEHQNKALQPQMSGAPTNLLGTPLYYLLQQPVSSLCNMSCKGLNNNKLLLINKRLESDIRG